MRSWRTLIEVPLASRPRTVAELIGVLLAQLAAPLADSLIGHHNSTFTEELFHIPKTQAEAKVQPHSVTDNFDRKAVVLIFGSGRRCLHALITSYQTAASQASQEVENAAHCCEPHIRNAIRAKDLIILRVWAVGIKIQCPPLEIELVGVNGVVLRSGGRGG
jgi:hypothetical protein